MRFACNGLGIDGAILNTYILRIAFGDKIVEDGIDGAIVNSDERLKAFFFFFFCLPVS